jgi:fluoride exporter
MWVTPATMVTSGAFRQLVVGAHAWKLEPGAGRASRRTLVPAGKTTLSQVPLEPVVVRVQSTPAGCEVTRPAPSPARPIEMAPKSASNWVVTVSTPCRVAPPAVPMMIADWLFWTGLVVTVKLAVVDPAVTVTSGGTVAAVVLSLDRDTTTPPPGAAEVKVTVPVTGVPPTTRDWLRVSEDSDGAAGGGGGVLTVHPLSRALAGVAEPSFTSTVQSAGAVKPERSTRKRPSEALVPIGTPSTVIVRLGAAEPSMRSWPPLISAREMVTAAYPAAGTSRTSTRARPSANSASLSNPARAGRRAVLRPPRTNSFIRNPFRGMRLAGRTVQVYTRLPRVNRLAGWGRMFRVTAAGSGPHYEEPVDPDLDPAHLPVVLSVSLGGGIGALARYALDRPEVWATLLVNLLGCALIGVLVVLTTEVWRTHPLVRPLLGTGVLGGFTTFSAYALDTHQLWSAGDRAAAAGYLVGTLLGCLAATSAAVMLARRLVAGTRS